MTRPLQITHEHLRRFADASGDRNPLHLDELFARRTPYGRCICHGALVTIAALGIAETEILRLLHALDVQFKQPVFPDDEYKVSLLQTDSEKTRIEVGGGGRLVAAITLTTDPESAPLQDAPNHEPAEQLTSPRCHTLEELQRSDVAFRERYSPRMQAVASLAADLGAAHVPSALLGWLSAASYTVGMLVPGRDAVFVGARMSRSSAPTSGTLKASVSVVDDRTGFVVVDAELEQGDASAGMTLQTFLRPVVAAPDRSSIGRYLAPSTELSGRNILVVGASRGLGAALSGAFATQGATVWAGFARSTKEAQKLSSDFGPENVRLLQFDAEDVDETRRAFEKLRADVQALDGVVFCAAPALHDSALHDDASGATLRSLKSSLAMVLTPLTQSLDMLSPRSWLIVMSSAALDDPPEAWPHYVIAKAAVEGLATYCARHTRAPVLIIRAPKMWTDSTNTPLARIGAVGTEQVAAAIVRKVISEQRAGQEPLSRPLVIRAEELLEAAAEPETRPV